MLEVLKLLIDINDKQPRTVKQKKFIFLYRFLIYVTVTNILKSLWEQQLIIGKNMIT